MTSTLSDRFLDTRRTDSDGTEVVTTSAVDRRRNFMDFDSRLPAIIGLAKEYGAVYAENTAGMTPQRALEAAGLAFTVELRANEEITEAGGRVHTTTYPGKRVRADYGPDSDERFVGMGTVGEKYSIVQPAQLAELAALIMKDSDLTVVAAAGYGKPRGSRMYLALKVPEPLMVAGMDRHDLYLTLGNSFNGDTSVWGLFAPIRIACTNMTTATFGARLNNRFSLRHTGDVMNRAEDARIALGVAEAWSTHWDAEAKRLLGMPVSSSDIDAIVEKLLPTPASVSTDTGADNWEMRRLALRWVIKESPTNEIGRGTAYAVFNGAIEFADFGYGFGTRGEAGSTADTLARYTRTLHGDGRPQVLRESAARLLGVGRISL